MRCPYWSLLLWVVVSTWAPSVHATTDPGSNYTNYNNSSVSSNSTSTNVEAGHTPPPVRTLPYGGAPASITPGAEGESPSPSQDPLDPDQTGSTPSTSEDTGEPFRTAPPTALVDRTMGGPGPGPGPVSEGKSSCRCPHVQ